MNGSDPVARTLEIRSSPHVASGSSVDHIMQHVVLALLPAAGFAVFAFGATALLTLLTAVASCVLTEHLLCRLLRRPTTVGDWSVVITGLLYGMTLPPALPLWMTAAGGVIAVAIGKSLFGGLGYNPFNPALVGRAVLQAAFPLPMTTWLAGFGADRFTAVAPTLFTVPFSAPVYDAVSGATPLKAWKFDHELADVGDLLLGSVSGSTGETCALLIVAGGIYLAARRMLNWRIPVVIFATVALFTGVLHLVDPGSHASPLFHLASGGLALGAVFMATDMVASPMTNRGCAVYALLIGVLVVVIRVWGGMPEGVMYAILLGNAASPHIDAWLQPVVYGTRRRREEAA